MSKQTDPSIEISDTPQPGLLQVTCPECRANSSAYKTAFDNSGTDWQIICFDCGHITANSPQGVVTRRLRHKCRVRFRLG
jgi:ribosomal protein S27E